MMVMVKPKIVITNVLLALVLILAQTTALHAQEADSASAETPVMGGSIDDAEEGGAQQETTQEQQAQKDDGNWYDFFFFWEEDEPEEPKLAFNTDVESQWHLDVARYEGIKENEFHRYGYAKNGNQWYPVLFVRRFKMMNNQYMHRLIINGRPNKLPRIKGIETHRYGIVVTNEGFEYQMPTVASVSRQQKRYDEEQSLKLAESRLSSFGFEQITWVPDRKKETKDLAETWDLQAGNDGSESGGDSNN